jgi:hypothetical protein
LLGFLLPGADGLPGRGPGVEVLGTTDVVDPDETLIAGSAPVEPEFCEYDALANRVPASARAPAPRKASFHWFFMRPPWIAAGLAGEADGVRLARDQAPVISP